MFADLTLLLREVPGERVEVEVVVREDVSVVGVEAVDYKVVVVCVREVDERTVAVSGSHINRQAREQRLLVEVEFFLQRVSEQEMVRLKIK